MTVPSGRRVAASFNIQFFSGNRAWDRYQVLWGIWTRPDSYIFNTGRSVQSNDYRSLASTRVSGKCELITNFRSGKAGDQLINLGHRIIEMRSNTQTLTTWRGNNVSILEMGIERHRAQITVPYTNDL